MGNRLTPKVLRFIDEYCIDMNGTQAAIRAGYKEKAAYAMAAENLRKPQIREAIMQRRKELSEAAFIDATYVLEGLKANAERAMQAVEVLDRDGKKIGEYTYQGSVANRAYELLGRHLGILVERREMTGKDGGPIQVQTTIADIFSDNDDQDPS